MSREYPCRALCLGSQLLGRCLDTLQLINPRAPAGAGSSSGGLAAALAQIPQLAGDEDKQQIDGLARLATVMQVRLRMRVLRLCMLHMRLRSLRWVVRCREQF